MSGVSLAAATLVALLVALTPAAEAKPRTGERLRDALDEVVRPPDGPPGLSVLLQRGKDVQFMQRGVSDLATEAPFTRNQHYRIASMAKAFNGAVVLALVSKGRLELDDTIGEVLPGVLPLAENVTVGQAIHHTGSLPDYILDPEFRADFAADPTQYLTPLELVEYVEDTEPEFPPGERYEYSDTDNVIAGLMAEAATGKTYDELLEQHVYSKAALTNTTLPITIEMPEPYVHGYDVEGSPPEDLSELINPALAWASGGIVSTPNDVNRFIRAYVGGDLFNAPTQEAQSNFISGLSSPPGPGRNRAGLGLFRYETQCGTVYGHTGSFPGYRLFMAASRDGRRSVVFTVNAQITPGDAHTPGSGNQEVADLIRFAQVDAVCHVLR